MAAALAAVKTLPVVVVGCGIPNKSMGWYHLTQLVNDPRVRIQAVVEPWFLGAAAGKDAPGAEAFGRFRAEVCAAHPEAVFAGSVAELPRLRSPDDGPVLALLAARTRDAPGLFDQVCQHGATHVYVEKPGAETAEQLQNMTAKAAELGVTAVVGYNKNVSEYLRNALAALGEGPRPAPLIRFEHCNALPDGDEFLNFIKGPGAEGMVHNMMCHELALLVTFFGVSCDRIASVTLVPERSELVALEGGTKDWKRVCFRLRLREQEDGEPPLVSEMELSADRCAGNFSQVHLGEVGSGVSFRVPDGEHVAWVEQKMLEEPEVMPYLFLQDPDYRALKGCVLDHILAGRPGGPTEAVGLAGATEVLRLADMLKPLLFATLEAGPPYVWTPPAAL